jgi:asparagine N-glycosylation enzyme membrane subunit Stt3
MNKEKVLEVLGNKKFQWGVVFALLFIILIWSSSIRLSNWDLLTDQSTGEKIPLALDPFYFLRVSETMVSDGGLPAFDTQRPSPAGSGWHQELLPIAVVGIYNLGSIFNSDLTIQEANVASPVIFYIIGLILFFFVVYVLTKSKIAAIISSGLLAFSTAYLYRTMAGFSDHESLGMILVFACLLFYSFALKNFEKDWKRTILYGLGAGVFTSLVLASWGGAVTLILMVIPISFLLYWILKNSDRLKAISFYALWVFASVFFAFFYNSYFVSGMISRLSSTYGLIVPAVFGFILLDFLFEHLIRKKKFGLKKNRQILYTIASLVVLGSIVLTIVGRNVFTLIKEVWHAVLFPFGTGRVGLTVAENAQPYLATWIGQGGAIIFWLFVFGILLMGIEMSKAVKSRKKGFIFVLAWIGMICGMIFSRISGTSLLNGENFLSQLIYLVGVFFALGYFIWIKMNDGFSKNKLSPLLIILMSLMFVVVLNGRSAVRTFFLIMPFVFLSVGYFIVNSFKYAIKSKDEILRIVLWGVFLFALIGMLYSLNEAKNNVTAQAQYTGPSANVQWQGAMNWVNTNTPQESVFAHWWDYGYWVQTLGGRSTIADGGHFQGYYSGNERIGRYILTTDKPASAYSLMKTHDVSHLLIDPTDLGKYGAYSKIGSDEDWDRFSSIPIGASNEAEVQETAEGMIRIYQFGGVVDEDIYYNGTFLPGPSYDEYGRPSYKAFIGGIILQIRSEEKVVEQPVAVYVYNGVQYRIPLRYLYVNGVMQDFGTGLEGTMVLIPSVEQSNQGMSISPFGVGIYLSPRTGNTLFAKLYLMNDPFNEYGDITLAHSEDDPLVSSIKAQGANVNDFVYYQGFRGPIKIWEVDYPLGTPTYDEFLEVQTGYADMDDKF